MIRHDLESASFDNVLKKIPMSNEVILELTFKEVTTTNGLFCQFDDHHGVLFLDVKNHFTADDFQTIYNIIEPYFRENGELRGIIINSKKFPYWSGAANRREYLDFAYNNHHKFKKAALVMDGFFTKIVARIARDRARPKMKIFKYNQVEQAQDWVLKWK